MKKTAQGPADTRMMGIVHGALRRDLLRTSDALTSEPYPRGRQRRALGEHIVRLMDFLHAHHAGEDAGLWPLVRARNPAAGALLDSLEAEHRQIGPASAALTAAGANYAGTLADEPRAELVTALDALTAVLFPHLDREVAEAMPVVSASITHAEWHAVEQEHNIKPKSLTQLGIEGHWLVDSIDPEGYQVVVHTVAAMPRFILLHGFARRYRRQAIACWGPQDGPPGRKAYGPAAPLPRSIPHSGRTEAVVDAPLDAVWRVVSEVTRTGEWSHECRRVVWLDGATKATAGVRFRGTNQAGPWTWSRTCEIVRADEPHILAWQTLPTLLYPDSSQWQIALEATGGKTRIVQTYQVLRTSPMLAKLYAILVPSHRGRGSELTGDLHRLGELAAADARAAGAAVSAVGE